MKKDFENNLHPASFKDNLNSVIEVGLDLLFSGRKFFTKMAAIKSGIVPASPVTSVEPVGCVYNCNGDVEQDVIVIFFVQGL